MFLELRNTFIDKKEIIYVIIVRNYGGKAIQEYSRVDDFESSVLSKNTINLLPAKANTHNIEHLQSMESKIRDIFNIWIIICVLSCVFSFFSYIFFQTGFLVVLIFMIIWLCSFIAMFLFRSKIKQKLDILVENQSLYESSIKKFNGLKVGCIYCKSILRSASLQNHRKSIKCQKAQKDFHLTPEQKTEARNKKISEQRRLKKAQKEKERKREEKKLAKENKQKNRKNEAFTRKNFQPGHSSISMKKKEQIWKSGRNPGSCQKCNSMSKKVSFWWTIHPELKIMLLCDMCAKSMDLFIEVSDAEKKSRSITRKVRDAVWRRDEGRCVECSSNENLEFDHIIPFSKGGSNTERNIQLLCEVCNRSKSNNIGS